VLSVERFDRRWIGAVTSDVLRPQFHPKAGQWIARLPQEDFCQATGKPPTEKYEADGGPTSEEILEILEGSESRDTDRAHFVLAQLAFWLLAATDGHAKNVSIFHRAGGAFGMTPLYDVLSAWPVHRTRCQSITHTRCPACDGDPRQKPALSSARDSASATGMNWLSE